MKGIVMLSFDDAVKTILDNVQKLSVVGKPLSACTGLVASENIYADFDLPQSAIASFDGYAVRTKDINVATQNNPVILRITGKVRAGFPTDCIVSPGTAVRIMTGSIIPRGADCVVGFEDTDEPVNKNGPNKNNPKEVKICAGLMPGDNIWPAGSNVRKGSILIPEGTLIGPVQISAIASMGKTRIMVIRRPTVAIIATGDELVPLGGRLAFGKIYSGNSVAVAALVRHYGGIPKILGIARDKEKALISKLQKGMMADAIVTIGGVSKGDYDLVRLAVVKTGKVVFSGIRMMPGTSTAFGVIKRFSSDDAKAIPVFSLSGPPAACLINFETLVRPALLRMLGYTAVAHPSVEAIALDAHRQERPTALAMFTGLQALEGGYQVKFNIAAEKSVQASMAAANSLTIIPEGTAVKAGDKIQVLPLDWRREQLFI
ncbi:MAG: gephyrin-like molybdotransferase Glp [Smithella sp.]